MGRRARVTTYHVGVSIVWLLESKSFDILKDKTEAETEAYLRAELAKGRTIIPLNPCDHQGKDGTCQGHP